MAELKEVELVDLSPEAKAAKENRKKARPTLVDIGRLQALIDEYQEANPYLQGVVDSQGQPVKAGVIAAHEMVISDLDIQLRPIVQDMCKDSEEAMRKKLERIKMRSNFDSSRDVKLLDTSLSPLRGNLTVPPVISGR